MNGFHSSKTGFGEILKVHVLSNLNENRLFRTVVLVDVLRSSSTIIAALNNGAEAVIPFANIGEMMRVRIAQRNRSDMVLVGERHGMMPSGFDYNISPLDMTTENIGGKTVLYSSTNLTRVLRKVRNGHQIIVGSISNAKATATHLRSIGHNVTIIPCGSTHRTAIEDIVGAGAIVNSLMIKSLPDSALIAVGLYKTPEWRTLVKEGRTAKQLCKIGFEKDVDYCLSPNITSVVPVLVGNKIVRVNIGREN